MSFDFLSPEARRVVVSAQRLARGRGEEEVDLEHMLCVLADVDETADILRAAGADPVALKRRLNQALASLPKVSSPKVYLGERVLRLFDVAQADARERGEAAVLPVHLLLGLPLEAAASATSLLREAGATLPALEAAAAASRVRQDGAPAVAPDAAHGAVNGKGVVTDDDAARFPQLQRYARDLTALAAAGKLDKVIGRHAETRRVLQILARREKNNPILVGEPGVGKTALVEGLAQRIVAGDVPELLRGRRIFALDVGALVAGARFRGDFEDRVRGVLAEVREAPNEILLFVDEIHTLVGAGKGEGSLDAASLLKPALARGEIVIIGATTSEEYRRIEKDAAFERRFAQVVLAEPDAETCVAMLRGAKARYESTHGVRITDAALVAAEAFARRYVSGRALPDKAFDLLDEACARLRLELDSHPDEVDALDREARALRVEIEGLQRERGADADERRGKLQARLTAAQDRLATSSKKWHGELAAIKQVAQAALALEGAQAGAEAAEKTGALEAAARLRFGDIPALEQALTSAETALVSAQGGERLLEGAVEPVHIARVVEDATGIKMARMLEGERAKVAGIEDRLRQRVVGQDAALARVGSAIKRSRAGLSDPGRPIGSFLFLGPTGVGKTELAKALAEFLFDDEHALVRLDMSEYMEKHAVARLVGAPPGYVGYEEGGQLTEAVRNRPYAVVLLDEVEKAHPDVFNLLLALLDDGRLTDSLGRTVSYANVVLIMTSNLGSQAILAAVDALSAAGAEAGPDGDARRARVRDEVREHVQAALREHFRPEFLNRVDETVIFEPLGPDQIAAIVDLQITRLRRLLSEQKLTLSLTDEARRHLATASYDPAFGARPVKRTIQKLLRDPLAQALIEGTFASGDTVAAVVVNGTLRLQRPA